MSSEDTYQHQNTFKMEKIKVLGFMPIFYAGDYLKESLLSVEPYVDKMVISYTKHPSQGHVSTVTSPDSKEYILSICQEVLGGKLIWEEAHSYNSEGEHRAVKYKYSKDFDIILSIDSDEIMLDVDKALRYIWNHEERYYGINGYQNFFRSFSYILTDGFRPIRGENLHRHNQRQNLDCEMVILHFSCAQRREIMELKYKIFGHASEVRPNYLEEIFYKWTPNNQIEWLHPVSLQIWQTAKFFNKYIMPLYLHTHKNFNLTLIP